MKKGKKKDVCAESCCFESKGHRLLTWPPFLPTHGLPCNPPSHRQNIRVPSLFLLLCINSAPSPSMDVFLQHSCPLEDRIPQALPWGQKPAESELKEQCESWRWVSDRPRAREALRPVKPQTRH